MIRHGLAILLALSGLISFSAFAGETGLSTGNQTTAAAVEGLQSHATHSGSTWSTEGTGSCDTGNLTCNATGRQIGCNATGDYVYCSYASGDVGTVYCYASSNDGTTSSFSDACP